MNKLIETVVNSGMSWFLPATAGTLNFGTGQLTLAFNGRTFTLTLNNDQINEAAASLLGAVREELTDEESAPSAHGVELTPNTFQQQQFAAAPAPKRTKKTSTRNEERATAAVAFLKANKDQAFSSTEFSKEMGWPKTAGRLVLKPLCDAGKVQKAGDSPPTTRYSFSKKTAETAAAEARTVLTGKIQAAQR